MSYESYAKTGMQYVAVTVRPTGTGVKVAWKDGGETHGYVADGSDALKAYVGDDNITVFPAQARYRGEQIHVQVGTTGTNRDYGLAFDVVPTRESTCDGWLAQSLAGTSNTYEPCRIVIDPDAMKATVRLAAREPFEGTVCRADTDAVRQFGVWDFSAFCRYCDDDHIHVQVPLPEPINRKYGLAFDITGLEIEPVDNAWPDWRDYDDFGLDPDTDIEIVKSLAGTPVAYRPVNIMVTSSDFAGSEQDIVLISDGDGHVIAAVVEGEMPLDYGTYEAQARLRFDGSIHVQVRLAQPLNRDYGAAFDCRAES